jgi:outer membrane immunogenic protein
MNTAQAADMPVKAPIAPAYNWTGFYVGLNAGGAFGSSNASTSTVFNPNDAYFGNPIDIPVVNAAGAQAFKSTNFTGGLEVGYNWQSGKNFVFGVEADFGSFSTKGTAANTAAFLCCAGAVLTIASNASTTWLATTRARVGVTADNWLFFGTGGAAFTNVKASFSYSDNCGQIANCNFGFPNGTEAASFSGTKTGYAVGGGVEAAFWKNWSAKAEYLYVNFGAISGSGAIPAFGVANVQPLSHSVDVKANIIRLGLNYHF